VRKHVFLLFTTVLSLVSFSQTATTAKGKITGLVVDQTGAVIPGAHVFIHANRPVASGVADKIELQATTDAKGAFRLELPAGPYDILITAYPWRADVITVLLKANSDLRLKRKLIMLPNCDWPGINCDTFK
jgi:hypothetical protein